jgi:hypothetical protein
MSSIVVVAPLIVAGWPVITAAVTAAVGSMGFSVVQSSGSAKPIAVKTKTRAEIDVEDSEVLEEAAPVGELVIQRDDVRVIFNRDARGALKVCVEGENHSKSELQEIGREVLGRVTQQYVYHRIVTELQDRHMAIVDEQVSADHTVKLRVRNL